MTIQEALGRLDALKFNSYSQSEKIEWLSQLDGMVKKQIIDTHDGAETVTFTGYDDTTPVDQELLVPYPYDGVYLRWLEAQIDYHNGEFGRYNNAMVMFNQAFSDYANYYNQQHMPVCRGSRFRF